MTCCPSEICLGLLDWIRFFLNNILEFCSVQYTKKYIQKLEKSKSQTIEPSLHFKNVALNALKQFFYDSGIITVK